MTSKRKSITEKFRRSASDKIINTLITKFLTDDIAMIMTYIATKGEVDTYPLIKYGLDKGVGICVPRTFKQTNEMEPVRINDLDRDLQPGSYGIPEPVTELTKSVSISDIDIVIVPGVAFDESGYRLGFGGGYYDKFINSLAPSTKNIALAYEFQIFEKLPRDSWDKPVHAIITEKQTRFINKSFPGQRE